jgi:hypothetical protein
VLGTLDLELSPNPPLTGVEIEEYNSQGSYHLELVDPFMTQHTTGTTVGGEVEGQHSLRATHQNQETASQSHDIKDKSKF